MSLALPRGDELLVLVTDLGGVPIDTEVGVNRRASPRSSSGATRISSPTRATEPPPSRSRASGSAISASCRRVALTRRPGISTASVSGAVRGRHRKVRTGSWWYCWAMTPPMWCSPSRPTSLTPNSRERSYVACFRSLDQKTPSRRGGVAGARAVGVDDLPYFVVEAHQAGPQPGVRAARGDRGDRGVVGGEDLRRRAVGGRLAGPGGAFRTHRSQREDSDREQDAQLLHPSTPVGRSSWGGGTVEMRRYGTNGGQGAGARRAAVRWARPPVRCAPAACGTGFGSPLGEARLRPDRRCRGRLPSDHAAHRTPTRRNIAVQVRAPSSPCRTRAGILAWAA